MLCDPDHYIAEMKTLHTSQIGASDCKPANIETILQSALSALRAERRHFDSAKKQIEQRAEELARHAGNLESENRRLEQLSRANRRQFDIKLKRVEQRNEELGRHAGKLREENRRLEDVVAELSEANRQLTERLKPRELRFYHDDPHTVPIEITPADPSLSQCSPALASVVGLLSQRHTQTLLGMLRGLSEKQVARALHISPHTVHVYVKRLYRQFDVQSRGELIGKFVAPAEIAALEAKTPVRFEPIRPMPKKPPRVFTPEQVLSIREALMSVRWPLRALD